MNHRLKSIKDKILENYWNDPVWSKVISAVIITVGGSLIATIGVLIKSIYDQVSFNSVLVNISDYFSSSSDINNFVIWVFVVIISISIIVLLKEIIGLVRTYFKERVVEDLAIPNKPQINIHSTVFFSSRLASAFPGQRGLCWYEDKDAVNRLMILLEDPLIFESTGFESVGDPVWWFRGNSALHIDKIKRLSKNKILLGRDELKIKRIAVFESVLYYKSFIYVEVLGDKQTGLNNIKSEDIDRHKNSYGYYAEEYGLFDGRPIKREEFDDGATTINGKVVQTSNAELRIRYLTDYNFIISAKQSPYNSHKFCEETQVYFDKILDGDISADSFFDYLETYNKREE